MQADPIRFERQRRGIFVEKTRKHIQAPFRGDIFASERPFLPSQRDDRIRVATIPTGLRHPAQGWRSEPTGEDRLPWVNQIKIPQP